MPARPRISKIGEGGQVSIPVELRQELSLEEGRLLRWEKVNEHELRIEVLPEPERRGAMAMLGFARRFRAPRRTADWMKELREGES